MYCRTSAKFFGLIVPSSTCALMSLRYIMYSLILPISCFFAASQLASFTFPLFCTTILGMIPARRHIVAAKTSSKFGGGLSIPLQLLKSFWSRVSRALMAASTAGSALARSFSVSRCFLPTSSAIFATCSFSTWALAVSTSAMAFSLLTVSAICSALSFFVAASSSISFKSCSSFATPSLVSRSLASPFSRREIAADASLRLSSRRIL
mmetsp:Transcript_11916/g.29154  ORF Transcript_11916/g.29154 Transcript_11916/m.29154 type:complete len:208 (-) Transcript_11916:4838-5461(-)